MTEAAAEQLRGVLAALRTLPDASDNAERADLLRLLEEVKAVAAAVQLRTAVEFDAQVRTDERAAGVPVARRGRGVAGQLGLALRRSPHATQTWLWHAKTLTADLPRVLGELAAGRTSEWRALLVAREVSVLSGEHRAVVDARIAPTMHHSGDRRVEGATRALAQTLDAEAAVKRARRAASDRRVTIRPVADTMARLSILTPLAEGVAAYAALSRTADTATTAPGGEPRGRGQLMADTAIERLTGQTSATDVPVTLTLVMPVETLLARDGEPGRDTPAQLHGPAGTGTHPLPATLARDLALTGDAPRWVQRLFIAPATGRLVQLETHRRVFTTAQRDYLSLRDQTCRTPWCDAPIRHTDHIRRHSHGGPTHVSNGQGLCAGCNYASAAPGWSSRVGPDGTITTTTPTGHRYDSPEPRPPTAPRLVERHRDVGVVEVTHFVHRAA